MAQFKSFAPGVEVNGETVLSIVAGMGAFRDNALEMLAENGIADPQPGQWFPQQAWLDTFKAIAEKIGERTLFSIGQKIPESAKFPPQINNIDAALSAIDVAYHMNHRNGEIGHYRYAKIDPKKIKMVCDNPYPCDFDRGIITAMARRFSPVKAGLQVVHDDTQPCRKKGANSCTYLVSW